MVDETPAEREARFKRAYVPTFTCLIIIAVLLGLLCAGCVGLLIWHFGGRYH